MLRSQSRSLVMHVNSMVGEGRDVKAEGGPEEDPGAEQGEGAESL
jgi:hypothetical protein